MKANRARYNTIITGLRFELGLRDDSIKMRALKSIVFSVNARADTLTCGNSGVKYLDSDLVVISPSVD